MAQAQRPTRRRTAQALLANFVSHATRPFDEPRLPSWYIYGTFVLLLVCIASVLLNIALFQRGDRQAGGDDPEYAAAERAHSRAAHRLQRGQVQGLDGV